MAELDFPLLPLIGIIGTFEGWVPTDTDLYYRGTNTAGYTVVSGTPSFTVNGIDFKESVGLACSKTYNFAKYSKLNVQFETIQASSNTTQEKRFTLYSGTSVNESNRLASAETTSFGGKGTFTWSLPIHLVHNGPHTIYLSLGKTGAGAVQFIIYRIWLS